MVKRWRGHSVKALTHLTQWCSLASHYVLASYQNNMRFSIQKKNNYCSTWNPAPFVFEPWILSLLFCFRGWMIHWPHIGCWDLDTINNPTMFWLKKWCSKFKTSDWECHFFIQWYLYCGFISTKVLCFVLENRVYCVRIQYLIDPSFHLYKNKF